MGRPVYRVKANSRPVPVVVPLTRPPSGDVLTMLGKYVDMAKAGDIDGIAVAATRRDGGITSSFEVGRSLFHMMGAVQCLDQRLRKEIET